MKFKVTNRTKGKKYTQMRKNDLRLLLLPSYTKRMWLKKQWKIICQIRKITPLVAVEYFGSFFIVQPTKNKVNNKIEKVLARNNDVLYASIIELHTGIFYNIQTANYDEFRRWFEGLKQFS
jgi:hypothetical protein